MKEKSQKIYIQQIKKDRIFTEALEKLFLSVENGIQIVRWDFVKIGRAHV